jgi:hypothetical protein
MKNERLGVALKYAKNRYLKIDKLATEANEIERMLNDKADNFLLKTRIEINSIDLDSYFDQQQLEREERIKQLNKKLF